LNESGAGIYRASMAFAEIIEDRGLIAFVEKYFRANAADVPGTTNNENFHPASFRRARVAYRRKAQPASVTLSFSAAFSFVPSWRSSAGRNGV
jgi:hypothetical protein